MRLSAVVFIALAALALIPALSFGGDDEKTGSERIRASLLADTAAIEPGKPFRVGVVLDIDEGWHTYWINPGDSGVPPIVKWKLPPGFTAGEIQWPTPKKFSVPGDMVNYGYDGRVMLMATITPPADFTATSIDIGADVEWLVCTDEVCLPGNASVSAALPRGKSTAAHAEDFSTAVAAIPVESPPADVLVNEPAGMVTPNNTVGYSFRWTMQPAPTNVDWFVLPPDDMRVTPQAIDAQGDRVVLMAKYEPNSSRGIVSREIYTVLGYTDSTGARRGVVLRFLLMPQK